jgi:hypothetical protein
MAEVDGPRVLGRVGAGWPRLLAAVLAGFLTGGFAAWAYDDDTFRPLAHTFGLWITAVALLSTRQPRRRAAVSRVWRCWPPWSASRSARRPSTGTDLVRDSTIQRLPTPEINSTFTTTNVAPDRPMLSH